MLFGGKKITSLFLLPLMYYNYSKNNLYQIIEITLRIFLPTLSIIYQKRWFSYFQKTKYYNLLLY